MGLDNGIYVKRNEYSEIIPVLAQFDDYGNCDFDICYWRKCYNVRSDILDILDYGEANYITRLTIDDIYNILDILKNYNRKTWVYGGWTGSIWTWDEHKARNKTHIKNLKLLIKLMKKYPDLEVYFFDSY